MVCDMTATERNMEVCAMSDAYLVRAVAAGGRDALDELMDRYMPVVSRSACRILCDGAGSEEVAGRVFAKIWISASGYDESLSVSQWIYHIGTA